MTPDEQVEALAEVIVEHQRIPMYAHIPAVQRCSGGCADLRAESDGPNSPRHAAHVARQILASDAFRALVAGERAAALREAAEAVMCGGCKDQGSHRRHCPRNPNYHPWIPLADRAESVGDSIGVPELANQAWALAGAIREAMPNHPYRPVRHREETP